MKTKNNYSLPVYKIDLIIIDRTSSPAHKGKYKNSVDFLFTEKDNDNSVINKPILAAFDGVVINLKDTSKIGGPDRKYAKYSNWIEIKHNNEEYTIYEHLTYKGVLVKIGDKIKKGDIIGLSGNTGWTYSSHLHFEVRKYNKNHNGDNFITLKTKFKEIGEK